MDGFKELLSSKLSSIPKELIPTISFGLIIAAIVLIVLFFAICVVYFNSQSKPKMQIRRDDLKQNLGDSKKVSVEDLPPFSGRIGEILTLWGLFKVGPVTKVFFKVLEIMKESTYDIRWRYKLPCFMMIGPNGSGKSTILNNLKFENLSSEIPEVNSMWKIFKEGAIFEFPRVEQSENAFWSFISELFLFIKPRRPLDGIIVTVPADIFLSESVNVEKQAQGMFDRIFQFQRDINFKLPIYFIVTKTDLIPGFQEFVYLLNENSRQQMFGWSCPYSLDISFSVDWINEIFSTIDDGIRKAGFYFARKRNADENLEKAVLFESYFEKIKPILSTYLLSMFRTHNPHDGLILRGVYFVGKQKESVISPSGFIQASALTPGVNVDASFNHLHNDDLYFLQDLFKDKIFKEFNIAHPISADSGGMGKTELRNKIIFAGSAVVVSFGWFWGNSNIKYNVQSYQRSMLSVKRSLLKIKHLEDTMKTPDDRILIHNQASDLLKNMPVVKIRDFFSVFVPQSWFFNPSKAIRSTVEMVFDSVVAKAMYIDLSFNAKHIITDSSYADSKIEKKDIFDVESFESFKALSSFAEKLKNVQKISSEYNSMRSLGDSSNVADITESLFNDRFEITDEMREHTPNKKIMPPKFNLADFKSNIESNLSRVFQNFVKEALDSTVKRVLGSVFDDIEKLRSAGNDSRVVYSTKDLAKLYSKIELIEDIFNNKKFAWIKESSFCPTPKYPKLLNELQNIEIIDADFVRGLSNDAEVSFNRYKSDLEEYKSELSGKLVVNSAPSEGLLQLKTEVKSLLELPFVCEVPSRQFVSEILSDKMLIWDVKRLKELSALIDKYDAFSEAMPEGMRAAYFDLYKSVAKKCFYPTIKSIIGNAEILEDLPMGKSRMLTESAYKKQATNIRNASVVIPKIVKILDEIIDEDYEEDFGFTNLIIGQYMLLLEKIDALLNLEKPYSASAAVFDKWDGSGNPKFMNLENPENVRNYLNSQFERIRFLAKDLASPVVDLLTVPVLADKVRDRRLISKWQKIIGNVDDYESNKPGNSIAALESFITENLSKISIDNFDQQGELQNFSQNTGDYFLSSRSSVAKSLISRADVVQYDRAAASYNKISRLFNTRLARKFPFGDSADEASVTDLAEFVALYDAADKSMYKIFERNKDAKNINPKVFDFLKSLESLMPFLRAWVSQSKSSDPNTCPVCFNVLLRPFADMEAVTSGVLDRMLSIKGVPVTDNSNGVFFNGDSVMVLFGWVASADEKPDEKASAGNLRIEGTLAAFTYEGRWAMFRLIEKHKMDKSTEYPNGVVLQFEIPVVTNKSETLTSKMVFKVTPMVRDGDKLNPLAWPIFPQESPDLYLNGPKNDGNGAVQRPGSDVPSAQSSQPSPQTDSQPLDVGVSFDEQ